MENILITSTEVVELYDITINDLTDGIEVLVTENTDDFLIEISEMGTQGLKGEKGDSVIFNKIAAETIPSYMPVAIINNLAYKLDASNVAHQFAFVGFSTNGTAVGQICIIQQAGELVLAGWGLLPNQHYLAGANGSLILENNSATNFTKVIGYALNANTLLIKDFSTTLKTN